MIPSLAELVQSVGVHKDMLRLKQLEWTIRLSFCGAALMLALIAYFYAADEKGNAMRVITAFNAFVRVLPRFTENWQPTSFNIRLYDGLVVLCMAAEGFLIGVVIDVLRFLRIRSTTPTE